MDKKRNEQMTVYKYQIFNKIYVIHRLFFYEMYKRCIMKYKCIIMYKNKRHW